MRKKNLGPNWDKLIGGRLSGPLPRWLASFRSPCSNIVGQMNVTQGLFNISALMWAGEEGFISVLIASSMEIKPQSRMDVFSVTSRGHLPPCVRSSGMRVY